MAKRKPQRGGPSQRPPEFTGTPGKRRLNQSLRSQTLIAQDAKVAAAFQRVGELVHFKKGEQIIRQGEPENDVLFIIHGAAAISVNGRSTATREAGTHIGEMSLVDHLATRSADAVAAANTVVLKVTELQFSSVAKKQPDLWRRVAVEIANRLRERNKSLVQPHAEPVVFIGSSSEGLKIVEALTSTLTAQKVVPRPWTNGVFEASSTTIESLMGLAQEADFAVLILTADDMTVSRGKKKPSPRDNVVFELGLLMGALGRDRVLILKPQKVDLRIPTDLLGVTWLDYRKSGPGTLKKKLKGPSAAIMRRVTKFGPR